MKLFEMQTNLSSYAYPIGKIIACLLIMIACMFRARILCFQSRWINGTLTFLAGMLTLACVLCIYISVGELFCAYFNKHNQDSVADRPPDSTLMSIDKIIVLVCENDVIELEVWVNGRIINIGASADCKPSGVEFFDKRYFIDKHEYDDVMQFEKELVYSVGENQIHVVSIDGIKQH